MPSAIPSFNSLPPVQTAKMMLDVSTSNHSMKPPNTTELKVPSTGNAKASKSSSSSTRTVQVKKVNKKTEEKLAKVIVDENGKVKPFSEIDVSTRTAIVYTNCTVDLQMLYQYVPVTDYQPIVSRRGRKSKNSVEPVVVKIPTGHVLRVRYENQLVRGTSNLKPTSEDIESKTKAARATLSTVGAVSNKKRKLDADDSDTEDENEDLAEVGEEVDGEEVEDSICPLRGNSKKKAYFLHCVVLDIVIDQDDSVNAVKFKNVKIYANGIIQITGLKTDEQYIDTVQSIFNLFRTVKDFTGQSVVTCSEPVYKAVFLTVMTNVDFHIGFGILRNKLKQFINDHTEYKGRFLSTQDSCVRIKIPIDDSEQQLMLLESNVATGECKSSYVNYADYENLIKKRKKKVKKHTFLIFATGHIIFTSARTKQYMESVYYTIVNMLLQNRMHYEEISEESGALSSN